MQISGKHTLTEKDLKMFAELYVNGPMMPAHLRIIMDEKSKYYIYRRLSLLKDYGYVDNKNYLSIIDGYKRKQRKIGTMYYLLPPGITEARKYLQIDLNKKARSDEPNEKRMYSLYHLGRIHAALAPRLRNGNMWLPGRLAKHHLRLSAKMRIFAMLKINGRRHAVYHISTADPARVAKILKAQIKGVNRIVDGHIVICATKPQSEQLQAIYLQENNYIDVRILNYSNAAEVLAELIKDNQHERLAGLIKKKYQEVELTIEDSPVTFPGLDIIPPGKHIGKTNYGTFFMSELLTENTGTIQALRYFDGETAGKNNLPPRVFVLVRDALQQAECEQIINNKHIGYICLTDQ